MKCWQAAARAARSRLFPRLPTWVDARVRWPCGFLLFVQSGFNETLIPERHRARIKVSEWGAQWPFEPCSRNRNEPRFSSSTKERKRPSSSCPPGLLRGSGRSSQCGGQERVPFLSMSSLVDVFLIPNKCFFTMHFCIRIRIGIFMHINVLCRCLCIHIYICMYADKYVYIYIYIWSLPLRCTHLRFDFEFAVFSCVFAITESDTDMDSACID